MLNPETKKLDQVLIRLLAKKPNLTAHALHGLAEAIRPATLQGVYHELRKLQKEGAVIKVHDTYTLSLNWAFEFMGLADSIYDNYIASASKAEILPAENEKKTWRFTNLLRLDDFWVQTMLIVFKHTKATHLYNWIPHPWYYFAQLRKVEQFYSHFAAEDWKYHATIGGNTFLDRRYAEAMPKSFFECTLGATPVFSDMSKYCTIIGDYMITVKLDVPTVNRVNQLFDTIKSVEGIRFEKIFQLLDTPAKLSFVLEHNPRKIGAYVRKYQRYFGHSA